jgi:nicotinamidase-related amidase
VKPVVVVIDMQNEIVRGRLAKAENRARYEQLVSRICDVLAWARAMPLPIVYTRICFRPSYVDANPHSPAIKIEALKDGEWGTEIIQELAPRPADIVVAKHRSSAFYGTDLELVLRGLRADTLLLVGLATNRAVESTVRDAHNRDLDSVVISDATAAGSEELHQNSLRSIADWFGQVMPFAEIERQFPSPDPR